MRAQTPSAHTAPTALTAYTPTPARPLPTPPHRSQRSTHWQTESSYHRPPMRAQTPLRSHRPHRPHRLHPHHLGLRFLATTHTWLAFARCLESI